MSNQESTVLEHIVSQIKANVDFLAEHNRISYADANAITKLLSTSDVTVRAPATRPFGPPHAPALPQRTLVRALWGYNENNAVREEDLSFSAGNIITITEENNADWWTGTVNGRSGLFPSSYVEKLHNPPTPSPAPSVSTGPYVTHSATSGGKRPYRPFGATHHGRDVPPPPWQGVNSVGLQEKGDKEEKKSMLVEYGSTIAHRVTGGVEFDVGIFSISSELPLLSPPMTPHDVRRSAQSRR